MERTVVCLSPVHIGTGHVVEPFDYILDGQRYRRIDHGAFVERLSEAQVQALTQWASTQADALAAAPDRGYGRGNDSGSGELARQRSQFHLLSFAQSHARELVTPLRQDPLLARYEAISQLDRNLQVREQVKDGATAPVVPGSSLKGAVRTALAYQALVAMAPSERQECAANLRQALTAGKAERQRNGGLVPRRLQERVGHELEDRLFRFGKSAGDIHADLMRFVSISDTIDPVGEPARLMVPQLHTFAPGRGAPRGGSGRERSPRGSYGAPGPASSSQGPVAPGLQAQAPLIVEAHAPGNSFRIQVRVDTDLLQTVHGTARRGDGPHWERCVRSVFGERTWALLQERGPAAQLRAAVWERIASACRAFARAVLAEDLAWAQRHDAQGIVRFCQRLADLPPESVLLRLGWGSHFMSTTLFLALRGYAEWEPLLADCFAVFDLGKPPGRRTEGGGPVPLAGFPRSRRLVSVQGRPAAPLGWLLVAEPGASLPPPLVTPAELLAPAGSGSSGGVSGGGRPGPGGGSHPGGGRRGQGGFAGAPRGQAPLEPRRPEPPLPKPRPPAPAGPAASGGPRRGERVKATVAGVAGRRVTVRLQSGEELTYELSFVNVRPGDDIKVKVDAVDPQGRITRVIPS